MSDDDDNSPISARAAKQLFADLETAPALVLAVSGGPDSVALMWLAARWRRGLARGPELTVVTVDHGLRPEAAREAREVKRLAAELGLAHRTLRWRGAKPNTGLPADLLSFSKWIAYAASPLATAQCIAAFGTTDFREDLKQFTIPTLIAHGDADRIVSFDISSKLAHEQIKGSRLEMIKGAPHGLAATHSEQLSELLLDFLGG